MIRTKPLDAAYERGRTDGLLGRLPCPWMMPKYERWAYNAGYRAGQSEPRVKP